MSRSLKYILTIILLIVAAMWILTVYRTCQAKKNTDDTEVTTNNGTNTGDDSSSDSEGELDELYDTEGSDEDGSSEDEGIFEDEDEDSAASDDEDDSSEDDSTTDSAGSGSGIANGSGEFLVVAGAFVAESNAKKMKKELSAKGIDSEIRIFLGSDYHSVIVGNYETESAAQSVVNKIGGEAYVHKKRYPKKRM